MKKYKYIEPDENDQVKEVILSEDIFLKNTGSFGVGKWLKNTDQITNGLLLKIVLKIG